MARHKVVGIIPARYNSSRFPGKVLAEILGKSLIRRTYENALLSEALDALIVATDDEKVFNHVKEFGNVVMSSPDCLTGSDRAAEVIKKDFKDAETVVVIQADEPCIDPKLITTLVSDLEANSEAALTTPVEPITDVQDITRPGVVKCVFDKNKRALYFSRSPIPFVAKKEKASYFRHLGVYCYRKEFLLQYAKLVPTELQKKEDLEQLKVLEHGFPIYVSIVAPQGNIGVDYPEDIKRVEQYLCRENTSLSQAASSLL